MNRPRAVAKFETAVAPRNRSTSKPLRGVAAEIYTPPVPPGHKPVPGKLYHSLYAFKSKDPAMLRKAAGRRYRVVLVYSSEQLPINGRWYSELETAEARAKTIANAFGYPLIACVLDEADNFMSSVASPDLPE